MGLSTWFGRNFKQAEEVTKDYGKWQRPDEAVAREQFLRDHNHHDIFDLRRTPIMDLREFGAGHLLYFCFLKYIAALFVVLAACVALPMIASNLAGGFYVTADLERTTAGDFGPPSFNGKSSSYTFNLTDAPDFTAAAGVRGSAVEFAIALAFHQDVSKPPAHTNAGVNKRSLNIGMSILDLIGCLAYFFTTMFMIFRFNQIAQLSDARTVTLDDYSVQVEDLPPDTLVDELRDYLEQFGEVVSVELARSCGELLRLVMARREVIEKLEAATAILQRHAEVFPKVGVNLEANVLEAKIGLTKINQQIKRAQKASTSSRVVKAFVIFKTERGRINCLRDSPRSFLRLWLQPMATRFRNKHALHISNAPEPSDVVYENLEHDAADRRLRRAATLVAKYAVLLIGFVLINLAPAIRVGIRGQTGPSKIACAANCSYIDSGGNYALNATNRILYKQCYTTGVLDNKLACEKESGCYECYCRATLNYSTYGEALYCSPFSRILALQALSQVIAVGGIVIINFIIYKLVLRFTRWEKHHTRSAAARSITSSLWQSQFVNAAFSSLIANAFLPGVADKLTSTALSGVIFTGLYPDFTPNWYRDVGRPLILSVFITAGIRMAYMPLYRYMRGRRIKLRHQCLTSHELYKAYEGHEFELADRYGDHMSIMFITLLFASGMPILYWITALYFVAAFWGEKYELLTMCKRPIAYSSDLAKYVLQTLPFAALWHLAFALWMLSIYGVPESGLVTPAFQRAVLRVMKTGTTAWRQSTGLTPEQVTERMLQANAAHMLIFFIVCLGILVLFFTLSSIIAAVRSLLSLLGLVAESEEMQGNPEFPIAVRSQLLIGPSSYSIATNPSYEHAFTHLDDFDEDDDELEAKVADLLVSQNAVSRMVRNIKKRFTSQVTPQVGIDTGPSAGPGLANVLDAIEDDDPKRDRALDARMPATKHTVKAIVY